MNKQMTAYAGDEIVSANDVQEWRKQDIEIADQARVLSDMQKPPWEVRSVTLAFSATGTYLNADMPPLVQHARLLSMISNPIASVGQSPNTAKGGSIHYVSAGNTRVECVSAERSRALMKTLNDQTFSALLPHRRIRMEMLRHLALQRPMAALPGGNDRAVVFLSAQVCVFTQTPAEADELVARLNGIYAAAINDDITVATKAMLLALGAE